MVRLTLIARVSDGLPLAEGLDSNKDHNLETFKHDAKNLFKRLSQQRSPESRLTIDAGACLFHYIIEGGVCYLTVTEKGYPKKLAYQYLEELQSEFSRLYGSQIDTVARPYAFIKFDTFIQKTKKLYADTRTQRNISKLSEDISEVHSIMTKNIQEVLGHGERLNRMTEASSQLQQESKKYAKDAKALQWQALMRKYVPLAVIVLVVLLVFYLRRAFYS
jgi:vesicle transport protein SEC22